VALFQRLRDGHRARRRIRQLDVLINRSSQVRMAWFQERRYIERTGRTDWVDPSPLRVHAAGHRIPPPVPPMRPAERRWKF
jgi:hypothetical protein